MNTDAYYVGPIVGWRLWRVMPLLGLDGERGYRLCSVGTRGIPKVWVPRQPTAAVCSSFDRCHEAPWPNHECGLWALRSQEETEARLAEYVETQSSPSAWAIGDVALWGRVIEHEHGWRAQFAYPRALSVRGPRPSIAERVADTYRVPVEFERVDKGTVFANRIANRSGRRERKERARETGARLAAIQAKLQSIQDTLAPKGAPPRATPPPAPREPQGPLPLLDYTDDDLLRGLFVGLVLEAWRPWRWGRTSTYTRITRRADAGGVALGLLEVLGESALGHELNLYPRLRRLARTGVIEAVHHRPYYRTPEWRFTSTGVERLQALPLPKRIRVPVRLRRREGAIFGRESTRRVLTAPTLTALATEPVPLAYEDAERLAPEWTATRRLAQAGGRRRYRAWLLDWRAAVDYNRLPFSEDEVYTALVAACGMKRAQDGAVTFDAIMDRLAPGDYGAEEAARNSQILVRLRKAGRVEHAGKESPHGRWRWRPTAGPVQNGH